MIRLTSLFCAALLGLLGSSALAAVTVKPGDTLYSISRRAGVSVARLRAINALPSTTLKIGQVIKTSWGKPAIATNSVARNMVINSSAIKSTVIRRAPVKFQPVKVSPVRTQIVRTQIVRTPIRRTTIIQTPTRLRGPYTVRSGDTLGKLARRSGLSVATLKRTNRLSGTLLRVGQRLQLAPARLAPARPAPVLARPRTESRTIFAYSVVGKNDTFRTLSQAAQRSAEFSPAQLMRLNKLALPWVYPGMKVLLPRRVSVPVPPAPLRPRASLQSLRILGVNVKVVRVDLRYRTVLVSPILPSRGLGSSARVSTLAKLSGATAVINGSYFHPQSFIPAGDLVVHGQRLAWGRLPAALSITHDNRARISSGTGGSWAGMESVVASGPQIVRGGAVQLRYPAVFQDPALFGRAARSAIGLRGERDLILVSTKARLSITEMGKIMARLGARDALLLDGGSSAGLSWNRAPVIESVRGVSYGIGVFLDYSGRRYSRL